MREIEMSKGLGGDQKCGVVLLINRKDYDPFRRGYIGVWDVRVTSWEGMVRKKCFGFSDLLVGSACANGAKHQGGGRAK
jgi:hypothetical protein